LPSLERSLQALNRYIKGGKTKALIKDLAYYDDRISVLKRDFYSVTMDDPGIQSSVETILSSLHIPKAQWLHYRRSDWTVSDFLAKLTSKGHLQPAYFLGRIEKKKSFSFWDLLMGGLLTAAISLGILSLPALSGLVESLLGVLTSFTGMPVIGMIFSGLMLLVGSGINLFDKKKSWLNRSRDLLFALVSAAFTFSAYAMWLSAFPVMPLVGAFLFVSASVVDAVREGVCLVQEYARYRSRRGMSGREQACAEAQYTVSYKMHRNAALINIVTAIVLVGLIAAWSFAPAGMAVTIGIIAAIVVVCVIKYVALKRNERVMRESLQEKMAEIHAHDEPSQEMNLTCRRSSLPASGVGKKARRTYDPAFFSSSDEDSPAHRLTGDPESISNKSSTRPTL